MTEIVKWAAERACELANEVGLGWRPDNIPSNSPLRALYLHVLKYETKPVDPMLAEARKIAADRYPFYADAILAGDWDRTSTVIHSLTALHRGAEIEREKRDA